MASVTRLFNEQNAGYTEKAKALSREIHALIKPIMEREIQNGICPRDLDLLLVHEANYILSLLLLEHQSKVYHSLKSKKKT